MSYYVLKDQQAFKLSSEDEEDIYVLATCLADSSLRDERNRMVKSWDISVIAYGETYKNICVDYARMIDEGTLRVNGIKWTDYGQNYLSNIAKGYKRATHWFKKPIKIDRVLPSRENILTNTEEAEKAVNHLNDAVRETLGDRVTYDARLYDLEGKNLTRLVEKSDGRRYEAFEHLINASKKHDDSFFFSSEFGAEIDWQKENGGESMLADALKYFYEGSRSDIGKKLQTYSRPLPAPAAMLYHFERLVHSDIFSAKPVVDTVFYAPVTFAKIYTEPEGRARIDTALDALSESLKKYRSMDGIDNVMVISSLKKHFLEFCEKGSENLGIKLKAIEAKPLLNATGTDIDECVDHAANTSNSVDCSAPERQETLVAPDDKNLEDTQTATQIANTNATKI